MPKQLDFTYKPVIGVIHLPPLPGTLLYKGQGIDSIVARALQDAEALYEGGVDAIIVENYGDKPYAVRVREPATIASMAIIVHELARRFNIPIGVSLLRNSGPEALAIAHVAGASFIRVNAYCEPRVAPEGLLEPVAREVMEEARRLSANIQILADVDVKHSYPLAPHYNVVQAVKECCERFQLDAIVVTGSRTGEPPDPGYVAAVKSASTRPIIVGSGVTPENVEIYWRIADGFIVGTYFKENGITTAPVDRRRVERLIEKIRRLRARV